MDDLRWILAAIGAVVVVATYLSSLFEKEEWRRDRESNSEQPRSATKLTTASQIKTQVDNSDSRPPVSQHPAPKVSVGLNSESDVSEALNISEQEATFTEERTNSTENDWEDAVSSTKEPLVEDEIVAVEIPAEFSAFAEERRSKPRLKFKSQVEEPVQQELSLDVEPLVLVLTILSKKENLLSGSEVKKALEDEGINHGDMEIFHFHMGEEKDAVFSVANLVEPGTFNLKTINEDQTPGLSLFCQLPGPVAGTVAFELLLKKARSIADNLGGQLCDDKRNLLTEQATSHYHDRITNFEREVALARKKQE